MKFTEVLKDVMTTKAYASRTISQDPLQSFMFKVSIAGLPTGVGFQKVGGLNREVAVVEYLENMFEHKHKLPGRESVGEVTFERGMYADNYLQKLYETVFLNDTCRNTVNIMVCDRFGNVQSAERTAEIIRNVKALYPAVKIKLNTVVNALNVSENLKVIICKLILNVNLHLYFLSF